MGIWATTVFPFLIAVLVLFVPGLVVSTAAGARGLWRWALAAPLTFTLAGVGAIALDLFGVRFSVWAFAIVTALVTAITAVTRGLLNRSGRLPTRTLARGEIPPTDGGAAAFLHRSTPIASALGLVVAAAAIGYRLVAGIGSPTAIAQLFDNVFHLNAVALIHSSGDGSSLTLGNLTAASSGFYPAAFHDVAALVMFAGVDDVSVALNVVSITLSAVVWPLSLMFLTTRVFGMRADVLVLTGVLAGAFGDFPYRMLSFGVLYPFHAGLSMLPVLIALILEFFGVVRTQHAAACASFAALLAAGPGIALTHPSVIVAGIVLAAPFVLFRLLSTATRGLHAVIHDLGAMLALAYLVVGAGVFLVLRPSLTSAPWTPIQGTKEAIGSILGFAPGIVAITYALSALGVVGLATSSRRFVATWPILGMFLVAATAYFAAAVVNNEMIRDLLSGVWYRDVQRLAALLAIASFPVVLLGALSVTNGLRLLLRRLTPRLPAAGAVSLALVAIATLLLTQRSQVIEAQIWLNQSFGQAGGHSLLSDDERALMGQVKELVPADGVIVGNPRTGASLTPAFAARATLAPHVFGNRTEDEQYLLDHWDEAATDSAVCLLIEKYDAYWALDFGTVDVLDSTHKELAGTDALSDGAIEGMTKLASVGDAALYEATACF